MKHTDDEIIKARRDWVGGDLPGHDFMTQLYGDDYVNWFISVNGREPRWIPALDDILGKVWYRNNKYDLIDEYYCEFLHVNKDES